MAANLLWQAAGHIDNEVTAILFLKVCDAVLGGNALALLVLLHKELVFTFIN